MYLSLPTPPTHVYFLEPPNFRIKQVFYRLYPLAITTSSSRYCTGRGGGEKAAPREHGTTGGIHPKGTFKWLPQPFQLLPGICIVTIWGQRSCFNLTNWFQQIIRPGTCYMCAICVLCVLYVLCVPYVCYSAICVLYVLCVLYGLCVCYMCAIRVVYERYMCYMCA